MRVDLAQSRALLAGTPLNRDAIPRAQAPREGDDGAAAHTEQAPAEALPQRSLSILVDENKQIVYRIIDERSGELVRQIPPEEVRRASRNIAALVRSSEDAQHHKVDLNT